MSIYPLLPLSAIVTLLLFVACYQQSEEQVLDESQALQAAQVKESGVDFQHDIYPILHRSCMPCHNSGTLPQVIERVQNTDFPPVDGDPGQTRERLLAELEELQQAMRDGLPLSYTNKEKVHQNFAMLPGEMYLLLEKGVMPPPWGPELLKAIGWEDYKPLTAEERVTLLRYAKPYSQPFLR
ncbi:MAG: hypothetical protein IGS03_19130 [Candidatus Sericytochromatia bacterium]|nr:hypothetical protein [Candidatus Sericytochromatia bacterium]